MRFSLSILGTVLLGGFATRGYDLVKRGPRTSSLLTVYSGQAPPPLLADIVALNATDGTFLDLDNVQGDVLVGMKKQKETFYFFHINDATAFRTALRSYLPNITSTSTLLSPPSSQPLAFVNLAFSSKGLEALGISDDIGDPYFSSGQSADAYNLGDNISLWESPFVNRSIHGVFLIGSDESEYTTAYGEDITSIFGRSISQAYNIDAAARPGSQAGHEHFGFVDGISNPAVSGYTTDVLPGQVVVPPGVILLNRPGDTLVRPTWALDGTFMVFRKLQQKVPEFNAWTLANAVQDPARNLSQKGGAALLGARMFGRWKSGAPTDLAPFTDDPALGADPMRNNDFNFAHPGENIATDQTLCPFSAHIRKVNPRADVPEALDVSHHGMRSSIAYGPEVTSAETNSSVTTEDRGLAFVEYQSSIADGFRTQQIRYSNTADFPPFKNVTPGIDPIIGQGGGRVTAGLDPTDQEKTFSVTQFIVPKGGEYFFVPSISAIAEHILVRDVIQIH